jgi:hypothetical protein
MMVPIGNTMYVVEETSDYSDLALTSLCCQLYDRGYFVLQILEPAESSAANGYKVIAYKRVK